ncbi:MAG: FAD-binding oxidoreductase [Ktedonobacteraceae bacterium]
MLQDTALRSLKALLPKGQVFTDLAALLVYEVDAGLDKGRPEGVVFPRTAEEVVRIVQWAAAHNVPLVARGAGTGLSGGAVADRGGVIVEFAKMNRILDVDVLGRSAITEPAVINLRLDEQAKIHSLYFPPDPASQRASTLGGNVSENSGGPHCFKYGVTTNYITGLDVVLADGRQVRVGGRALDYPEYDLCGLITGSEGTLALITSISARLLRNPPGVKTMLAIFDTVEQSADAVSAIIAAGLIPATMEMMDQKITNMAEPYAHAGLPLDAGAILIIEVDGYPASLNIQINEIEQLLQAQGVREIRIARNEEERYKIWLARKSVAGAITRLTPAYYTVDITVPRSRLRKILAEIDPICEKYALRVGHLMHAGDGNLHPMLLIPDPRDPELMGRVHAAGREMVKCCIEMGGSLTGEHGVGIEKREFMTLMHNAAELLAMWDIKQAFDPDCVLNPGKVFPAPTDSATPFAGYVQQNARTSTETPLPATIFAPSTAEEAAQGLLALSSHAQRRVQISNAVHAQIDADTLLTTNALRGIKTYAPDDLYITVGAGTPLAEVQAFLAKEGKLLPIASPWPDATIGGLVAANVNAPLRMRYGSIRDLVLYTIVALADGRVIRTGRPIVKNVAGYDLTKVFIGSHGTLGLLTDVTLKFFPQPRARRTLLIPVEDMHQAFNWTRAVLPLALTASAIMVCKGYKSINSDSTYMLGYTAEGLVEDVQAELDQVRDVLETTGASMVHEVETSGSTIWMHMLATGTVVRIGVPAKDLLAYMQENIALINEGAFLADMSSGCLYAIKTTGTDTEIRAWVTALRQPALAYAGYAIVMSLAEGVHGVDRWGYRPQALDVMKRLKQRWDPTDILHGEGFYLDTAL